MESWTVYLPKTCADTNQFGAIQPISDTNRCQNASPDLSMTFLFQKVRPKRVTGQRYNRVQLKDLLMNQIIYIVGAIVIVVALLSFVGLR